MRGAQLHVVFKAGWPSEHLIEVVLTTPQSACRCNHVIRLSSRPCIHARTTHFVCLEHTKCVVLGAHKPVDVDNAVYHTACTANFMLLKHKQMRVTLQDT